MKALVVFETMYGNTEKIAQAIGAGLEAGGEVRVVPVADFKMEQLSGLDLVVVGSPTQAFNPIAGTKDFLKALRSDQMKGIHYAAFDTRADVVEVNNGFLTFMVKLLGYAAEKIDRGLKARGGLQVVKPEGFFVDGKEGPMKAGELERAGAWAGTILQKL